MERAAIERGIGCVAIIPATIIGLAGLTDGIGPVGWRGLAEPVGWIAVCLTAWYASVTVLARLGRRERWRYVAPLIVLIFVSAFTGVTLWLGLGAPMTAKIVFTTSLQVAGLIAVAAFVVFIAYFTWNGRQRH